MMSLPSGKRHIASNCDVETYTLWCNCFGKATAFEEREEKETEVVGRNVGLRFEPSDSGRDYQVCTIPNKGHFVLGRPDFGSTISGVWQVNAPSDSSSFERHGEWQFVECDSYRGGSPSK